MLTLHHDRELWNGLRQAILERAATSPGNWIQHYSRLYANSQVSAVRRIIRSAPGANSITLGRVLEDVERNAALITVQWKVARAAEHGEEGHWLARARTDFLGRWQTVSDHLDANQVRHDRAALNKAAAPVLTFADNVVAHITANDGAEAQASYKDLDVAIDAIGSVFCRYYALLLDVDALLTPVIQEPWWRTFGVPLFPGRTKPT